MSWEQDVGAAIRSAARALKSDGWEALRIAARRRGEDDNWAHVFFHRDGGPGPIRLQLIAGTYCPLAVDVWGRPAVRERAPARQWWASAVVLSSTAGFRLGNHGLGHVPTPFDLGKANGAHPGVLIDPRELEAWIDSAFGDLAPELERVSSDRAARDWFARSDRAQDLRTAVLMGVRLGIDRAEGGLLERAEAATESRSERLVARGSTLSYRDRAKDPTLWSHERFLRYLEAFEAEI